MKKNKIINSLLISFLIIIGSVANANLICSEVFKENAKVSKELAEHPVSKEILDFAAKHDLPYRVIAFGPKKQERVVVALDYNNKDLVDSYLKRFNLESKVGELEGTLALEFFGENQKNNEHYVTGVLRRHADREKPIYRWNKEDLSYDNWWSQWFLQEKNKIEDTGIMGFSHIIGLNGAQKTNIEKFLDPKNEGERGNCKSNNCVAWISSIELGKTDKEAKEDERNYLFSHLGMSRASAHFEISRRLLYAANENHVGMFAFVNGEQGLKSFKADNLEPAFPPAPKIPFSSIIKGLGPRADIINAFKDVKPGEKVFFPIAAGASPEGMQALAHHAVRLKGDYNQKDGIDVHVLVNGISERVFIDATSGKDNDRFRISALFLGGNLRKLYSKGVVNYIPGNLGDFTRLMRDKDIDTFDYDTIVVRVAPPHGNRYSLGPNNDMIKTIIKNRPNIKIIAEVNENVPRTIGKNYITHDQIHSFFKSDTELAGPPVVPLTEVETNIGNHLGSLVSSGATLQVGIGNIFGGLANGLKENNVSDLTIKTEMFGDPLKDVMDMGIAASAKTGFAYGSKDLYKWLDQNKKIEIIETEAANNVAEVISTPKFHAINTALQVNIFGEVNATMGPNGRISSPGGQVEFMSGASKSEGGKAIIAIRSTAKEGTISTIVMDLYKGPITTPHESVTHVVTEYGIAKLAGRNEAERATALINVAHPKFRQQLKEDAVDNGVITQAQANKIVVPPQ